MAMMTIMTTMIEKQRANRIHKGNRVKETMEVPDADTTLLPHRFPIRTVWEYDPRTIPNVAGNLVSSDLYRSKACTASSSDRGRS